MSRIKKLRRQLETASAEIEALDAALGAGRLDAAEHERQRAAGEREVGRLFLSLRGAQGGIRGRPAEPSAGTASPPVRQPRSPAVMAGAAALLVVVGVGGGAVVGRWLDRSPPARTPGSAPSSAPVGDLSSAVSQIELEALQQGAAREDAPTPSLLRFAHIALDNGRLDEARRVYERVLVREPNNVEAITHIGGVLYGEGRVDEALAKIEDALRIDPRYIHAHWDRTQYLFHGRRDFPAAIRAGEAFLEIVPEGPDATNVRDLVAEARQKAAASVPLKGQ